MKNVNSLIGNKFRKTAIFILLLLLPIFSFALLSKKHNKPGLEYWHGNNNEKKVALTFDDGPNDVYTRQILDILKQNDVRATFFMIGKNVERYPEVAREVAESGEVIGNHSYTHRNLIFDINPFVRKQITRTQNVIFDNTGIVTNLFRPPFGGDDPFTLHQTKKLGYVIVKWSVSSKDWEKPGVNKIVNNVLKGVQDGAIILMHDGDELRRNIDRSQTVEALPIIISELRKQGYEFVTVPELLGLNK